MNIFYAVDPSPNHWGLRDSQVWHRNFYDTFREMGHTIIGFVFDFSEYNRNLDLEDPNQKAYIEEHRPELEQKLIQQVRAAHAHRPIDLFFSYFYSAHCSSPVIDEIKALGIPTVNFYCNASYQFHLVRDLAPAYDWCLVAEKFRLDDYHAVGANPYYFQEAANPGFYRPFSEPYRYDVAFVGQMYGDRPQFIHYLHNNDVQVRVWGPNWRESYPSSFELWRARLKRLLKGQLPHRLGRCKRKNTNGHSTSSPAQRDGATARPRLPRRILGPPLSDQEMVRRYSESKISLGFAKCGLTYQDEAPIRQVRLRDFEATMSGAFYLMEYVEEIEAFFEVGKEVVCFEGGESLVDKARYYLKRDREREQIKAAGRRRALNDHTWRRRFEDFFRHSGIG
ncbi:MAG TPA: glycosyltransferase [Blastocatellia bacterium]|nr:glycosyltransferase [Blastocatellia bacterium]